MLLLLVLSCTDAAPTDSAVPADDTAGDAAGDTDKPAPDCSGGSGWAEGGWLLEGASSPSYIETAYVYVPADLPACAPLVFFGHGGSNAGGYQDGNWMGPLDTRLVDLADERGFVLVVPGVNEGNAPHVWGDEPEVLGHLDTLVEGAWAGADLDRDRLWFIGVSAGGHMAVYLGLYVTEPWTGIGAVSSGLGGYFDYPDTEPAVKVPFYVAHDPTDPVVDYSYSETLAAELAANGHAYTFEDWDLGGHGWNPELTPAILDWLDAQ